MSLHEGAAANQEVPACETVPVEALLDAVRARAAQGHRFVTATCLDQGDRFELYYHFDSDLTMQHLRVLAAKGTSVPSISGVYLAAFLVENEMKELFGIEITDIAIDYQGRLYLTDDSEPAPMARPDADEAVVAVYAQQGQ